jgi:hypothetical protein
MQTLLSALRSVGNVGKNHFALNIAKNKEKMAQKSSKTVRRCPVSVDAPEEK